MHYSAQRRHGRRHGSRECWVPAFCVCSLPLCFSSVITWRGKMWQKPSKQVDSTIRMHKLLQASINTNSGINKFAKPESKTLVIPLHIHKNIRVATFCLTLVCHINLQSYLLAYDWIIPSSLTPWTNHRLEVFIFCSFCPNIWA